MIMYVGFPIISARNAEDLNGSAGFNWIQLYVEDEAPCVGEGYISQFF